MNPGKMHWLGVVALFSLLFSSCPKSPVGKLTLDDLTPTDEISTWETADGNGGFSACEPCVADETCSDSFCIPLEEGDFCLERCDSATCPEGFDCQETEFGQYCVPLGGTCACTPGNIGEQKACSRTNDSGQCMGLASCYADKGWVCDAQTPEEEFCDYEDNNCDGTADETFLMGDYYFGPENCGDCGILCDDEIENGTGYCSLSPPPPACKVSACEPGYYSPDGEICLLQIGSSCTECLLDEDCAGGSCFSLDAELVCLPDCGEGCPAGYECQAVDDGQFCFPLTGSCNCTDESIGLTKSCETANGFGICFGLETCAEDGWSVCSAQIPALEECNGTDDNCNGVADEELSGVESCLNSIPGIGACPGLLICEGVAGLVCNALPPQPEVCDYKDNNCDEEVDEGYLDPQTGTYLTDTDCGTCGNDCTVDEYPNAQSLCGTTDAGPACAMECLEGWVDLNQDKVDGCECEFMSADDPPDGVDQNCDGIDGDPANAVFVSPDGNDLNPGTPEQPVRTISMGLQRAQEQVKGHVYVAAGMFKETVKLKEGVQVFGGFAGDFSVRDLELYVSSLEGDPLLAPGEVRATVVAPGVGAQKTSFEGFVVMGPYVNEVGRSSYAVYVRDSLGGLVLQDNVILAGDGGAGEIGVDGVDGQDGAPGKSGQPAFDAGAACINVTNPGAVGGSMTCGDLDVSGGTGGNSICPDFNEWSPSNQCPVEEGQTPTEPEVGGAGQPLKLGGIGGEAGRDAMMTELFDGKYCGADYLNCGYCHISVWGTDGLGGGSGIPGNHGGPGYGCSDPQGAVVAGEWQALPGLAGGGGQPGTGGGGGGAGGGVETYGCAQALGGTDMGGSGGGGGSGACAGSGGHPGTGGGGTFGIFIIWSGAATGFPVVQANQVDTGHGGHGGKAGKGGVGGTGGWAGMGGVSGAGQEQLWCAGEGGEGGHGGNGGSGGGGGGSCGGMSVGVYVEPGKAEPGYLEQLKAGNLVNLAGSAGAGGAGGASKGNSGGSGATGFHDEFNF